MKLKEFAEQLKSEIERFSAQGNESIKIDILTSALDKAIAADDQESEAVVIERLKAYLQSQVEIQKYNHAVDLEMFKSIIETGQNAIKSIMLLNGGAAVALLAFIGKLAGTGQIPLFATPLTTFVIGAFTAGLTSGISYLTQLIYSEEGKLRTRSGIALQAIAVLLGLLGLAAFGYGTYKSYFAFIGLGP
ncbi:hypothetical protein [Pseudomonas sp. MYb118]|uniref:hypothetical protein n=1 Tax=Pseudomonas sp. MYb118 TaxID=1848720 RepID=UPI0034CE63A6